MRFDRRLRHALFSAMVSLVPVASAQTPISSLVDGINDPGRALSAQQTGDLNAKLAAFKREKNIRIAVLIADDIGSANIISYSGNAMKLWPPEVDGIRHSVLLVVAPGREKAWIETRKSDLELETAQRIIFEKIIPRFAAGHDIAGGIAAGLDQIISVLNGNPLPPLPEPTGSQSALLERMDNFRSAVDNSKFGRLSEWLGFAIGVALGFGLYPLTGRWVAGLLAAVLAGIGSWLHYGFIVPYAAGAFVIVAYGRDKLFGKGEG